MAGNQLRSVKVTRHRIEGVLNRAKIRLGPQTVGATTRQSHGYLRVSKGAPAVVKSVVGNLRTVFEDFEFNQENFKDLIVVRFRTKGSKGWWEG